MARNEIWALVWMYLVSTTAEGPRCPQGASTDQCREDGSVTDEYFYNVNVFNSLMLSDSSFKITIGGQRVERSAHGVRAAAARLRGRAAHARRRAARARAAAAAGAPRARRGAPARPRVDELALSAAEPLPLDPASVESLPNLRALRLTNVILTREALLLLPPTLRSLSLVDVGGAELPAGVFGRLPALTHLILRDRLVRELDLSEAAALRFASLTAPIAGVTLGPSVVNVTLRGVRGATLLGNCSSLQRVIVEDFEEPLPARWLAACPALREVHVRCGWAGRTGRAGRAGPPHADALGGARALRELAVHRCGLRELPPQWLADAPALVALDLSYNDLQWLPSELASAAALERVKLDSNRLPAAALEALVALPVLRHLSLEQNPLGDLCGSGHKFVANALSPLRRARGLRTLSLARTGLTRICRDWRSELEWLTDLDLRHNNVTLLEFDDLQWRRRSATLVDLRGNPVRGVHYTREQFTAVLAGNVSSDFASSREFLTSAFVGAVVELVRLGPSSLVIAVECRRQFLFKSQNCDSDELVYL
ncbi:unnamed protein product [Euphydryas editha]|uniref:Uncharacterized protein n=1 Tax=Euphydryas editha TaxID=104508 RepID=A0AAU9TI03_EUPED|nr:unnamed protein product [Euphydryas editha]